MANAGLHRLAIVPALFKRVLHDWALYPDHVVFLGEQAITFDSPTTVQDALSEGRIPPDMPIFIQDLGVFSLAPLPESKLAQLHCYQDVIERVPPEAVLRRLAIDEIAALLNWDAERYRQQLNK